MTEETEEKRADIAVKSFVNPDQAHKDASINDMALTDAFMSQAALFIHYGGQAARAASQVDRYKQLLKVVEAQVDKKIRDKAADEGKKLTEALVEKEVLRHPKVIQVTKALNEAKLHERLADVAMEGMRHRRDMLVQLGATARVEREGELRMTSPEARRGAERDRAENARRIATGSAALAAE